MRVRMAGTPPNITAIDASRPSNCTAISSEAERSRTPDAGNISLRERYHGSKAANAHTYSDVKAIPETPEMANAPLLGACVASYQVTPASADANIFGLPFCRS